MKKLMKTLAVAGMTMGLALGAKAELCNDCITFSSKGKFTVQMKKGSEAPAVNLEYSTDKTSWSTYDPTKAYEAAQSGGAGDYVLYWRGTSNTQFASEASNAYANRFTITTNGADLVACSGNVETLLDYKEVAAGGHPQMGNNAFFQLFKDCKGVVPTIQLPATNLMQSCYHGMFLGCTSLTAAPELPVTNLATRCYASMFSDCTSLTAAPELPSTNLAQYCYNSMFSRCTSLTAAPELPATNLTQDCYTSMFEECTSLTAIPTLDVSVVAQSCCRRMFRRCTNLVVNTEGPGKAWSIPGDVEIPDGAEPAASQYWATDMFKSTAGTITNSTEVTPGTTYYVASAPVTLDVTPVDNATFAVTTNDAPATVPCTINYITPVSVTYTAKPGYAFPGGKAEFTTNVTASAETLTVTLAEDQQPLPLPPVEYRAPVYNTEGDPTSGVKEWATLSTYDYNLVTADTATLNAGWWVVDGELSRAGITVSGAAHLILKDGCSLTAAGAYGCAGITVTGDANSLAIYGQTLGTGQLIATGNSGGAGIGGYSEHDGQNITINGGTVTAKGGEYAAGIGAGSGSHGCKGKNIRINGGKVKATAGSGCSNAIGDGGLCP